MAMNAIDLRKPAQPAESEKQLVRQYVLLPVLLSILQRDIDTLTQSAVKVRLPYYVVVRRIMDTIREDLSAIRKQLGLNGIRIYTEAKSQEGIRCKYVCRGYHEELFLSREVTLTALNRLAERYFEAA